jgi:hypothetical protein
LIPVCGCFSGRRDHYKVIQTARRHNTVERA